MFFLPKLAKITNYPCSCSTKCSCHAKRRYQVNCRRESSFSDCSKAVFTLQFNHNLIIIELLLETSYERILLSGSLGTGHYLSPGGRRGRRILGGSLDF